MRYSVFSILCILTACGTSVEQSAPKTQFVQQVTPAPPEYDLRLDTLEEVRDWQKETLRLASLIVNPPDPAKFDLLVARFKVTDAAVQA